MEQSIKDQLDRWVKGESVHNTERDECCPDFSCCAPHLLAPQHERETFAKAVEADDNGGESKVVQQMLMGFLGRSLSGLPVHLAGNIPDNTH